MGGIYKARTNGFSQEAVDENLKQVYMLEKILIDNIVQLIMQTHRTLIN